MLKYSVLCRKNPVNKNVKWYAQIAPPDIVDINKISELIAQNCTLTRHDIVACLSAFQEQLINALMEGKSVRLGDLGSFRVTMHSIGTVTEDAFTSGNIHRLSIRFVPASRLRKTLQIGAPGISLMKVANPPIPSQPEVIASETGSGVQDPLAPTA